MLFSIFLCYSASSIEITQKQTKIVARNPTISSFRNNFIKNVQTTRSEKGLLDLMDFFTEGYTFSEFDEKFEGESGTGAEFADLLEMIGNLFSPSSNFEYFWNAFGSDDDPINFTDLAETLGHYIPKKTASLQKFFNYYEIYADIKNNKETLTLLIDHWSAVVPIIKAFSLNPSKIKTFITQIRDNPSTVSFYDLSIAFEIDTTKLFQISDALYSTIEDEQYTIGQYLDAFGYDRELFIQLSDAFKVPKNTKRISGTDLISMFTQMILTFVEIISPTFDVTKEIVFDVITPITRIFTASDLTLSQRFSLLGEGVQKIVAEIPDIVTDSLTNLNNDIDQINGDGLSIKSFLEDKFGPEKATQISEVLLNACAGTESIGETLNRISNITGNEAIANIIEVVLEIGTNLQKDSKFKDFLESVEKLGQIFNENFTIYNEIHTLLEELSDTTLDIRDYQSLSAISSITNFTISFLENIVDALKASQELSDIIPDELVELLDALLEAMTTSLPKVLDEKFGVPKEFFEALSEICGTVSKIFNTISGVFGKMTKPIEWITKITKLLSNSDFTLVDIVHEMTGFDISAITEVLRIVLNVHSSIDSILETVTSHNDYIDLVTTINNLEKIDVYSFGNIVKSIAIPQKTIRKLKDYDSINSFNNKLAQYKEAISSETLTNKEFSDLINYDITIFSEWFAINDGEDLSDYSLRSLLEKFDASKVVDSFTIIAETIQTDKFSASSVENLANKLTNSISIINNGELSNTYLYVAIAVLCVIVLTVIISIITCCRRRKLNKKNKDAESSSS